MDLHSNQGSKRDIQLKNKWDISFKKPATYLILGFIILLIWMFTQEAKADTSMEVAPESTFISGEAHSGTALFVTERFQGKYDVGIALSTQLQCRPKNCNRLDSPTNQGVYFQRVVSYGKFEMGLGVSYWHNTTAAWSSHTPFALHMGYNFNRTTLRWRHFSTGGSSDRNAGWDLLTLAWNF